MSRRKPRPDQYIIISMKTEAEKKARDRELVTEQTLERGRKRRHVEDVLLAKELGISLGELQA